MRHWKRLKYVGLSAVVALGCGSSEEKTELKLGAILSLTGDQAGDGAEDLKGVQLAVDEINAAGGVLGQQLVIMNVDDETTPEGAEAAARKLVDEGVPAVFGAAGSSMTIPSGKITSAAEVVQVTGSSTSPSITALHATEAPFLFRTCSSDALQGALLAKRAQARGHTSVAVIHLPGAYGVGLADAFASSFTALGGTVTDKIQYVEGADSYTSVFADVYANNPQAILLVAYAEDGAKFIQNHKTAHADKQTFFYFTDSLQSASFISLAGAANFTFDHEGTGPSEPGTATYAGYKANFESKFSKAPNAGSFPHNFYDAVYLVAAAIEAGREASGPSIRDHLTAVSSGGTQFTPSQWKELVEAIGAGEDVDFVGTSGDVDLDENGEVVSAYDTWHVNASGVIEAIEKSVLP